MNKLRSIPSVDGILSEMKETNLPHPIVVSIIRKELNALRKSKDIPDRKDILTRIRMAINQTLRSRIQPVINGTGILIHTNLGRSPLSASALDTVHDVASGYSNLELDLNTGKRGGRASYLETSLALLCGAQSATVVNNCAAALVLILRHFCTDDTPEVVISRGELIQIGGGFRIPDILEASGARLREVGTTNKTTIQDYKKAIGKKTGLILNVHRSNFFMDGFVASPSLEELAALSAKKKVPLAADLGSGAVTDTEECAHIEHEPTPKETLKKGAHLVCFSGDKLLGGPQAGIICGKKRLVGNLKSDPFFRALRCDKLILSALQTTVDRYLSGDINHIPIIAMMQASDDELESRAKRIAEALQHLPMDIELGTAPVKVGGGSLPRSEIPSIVLRIKPGGIRAHTFAEQLCQQQPPVIGFCEGGTFNLHLRTIFPEQDKDIINGITTALNA